MNNQTDEAPTNTVQRPMTAAQGLETAERGLTNATQAEIQEGVSQR